MFLPRLLALLTIVFVFLVASVLMCPLLTLAAPPPQTDLTSEADRTLQKGISLYEKWELSASLAQLEQALNLFRANDDPVGEGISLAFMGSVYAGLGQHKEALAVYEASLPLLRESRNSEREAVALHGIGVIHFGLGQQDVAINNLEAAAAIRRTLGDGNELGETLYWLGVTLNGKGQYQAALDTFEEALEAYERAENSYMMGQVNDLIGWTLQYLGEVDDAIKHREESLAISRATVSSDGSADTHLELGRLYRQQARYEKALFHLTLVLSKLAEDEEEEWARYTKADALANMGDAYQELGEYERAIEAYEEVIALRNTLSPEYSDYLIDEFDLLSEMADVYRLADDYDSAIATYERMITLGETTDRPDLTALALEGLGENYVTNMDQLETAEPYLKQALVLYQELLAQSEQDNYRPFISWMNLRIGIVHLVSGRESEAIDSLERALAIYREDGPDINTAVALEQIGEAYRARGRYEEATDYLLVSLDLRNTMTGRPGVARVLDTMAVIAEETEELDTAIEYRQRVVDEIEAIRDEIGASVFLQSYLARQTQAYDELISLLVATDQPSFAFDYAERARAQAFYWSMVNSDAGYADILSLIGFVSDVESTLLRLYGIDAESAEYLMARAEEHNARIEDLQTALQAAETKPLNLRDTDKINRLRVDLVDAQRRFSTFMAEIELFERLDVESIDANALSAVEVQAFLPDDQVTLVEYHVLADDQIVAFVLTHDDLHMVELPDASPAKVTNAIEQLHRWTNLDNPHPRPLRDLYRLLAKPLEPYLDTKVVNIVPHQMLHYVPFSALTDGETYFGENHLLALLPSASILPLLEENRRQTSVGKADLTALVLGNPATYLPPLLHAEAEAAAVADLFGSTVYTGTLASERLLQTELRGKSVLHLATHGSYNSYNPLFSAIHLAADGRYDGRLETHEIVDLPLEENELVVLSACESSVGAISRGDEVVGLTRAFFLAGSPTVISSLWNVDDAATEALMTSFYRYWLEDGLSKAESLQAAQADVQADPRWISPFYWGGFVLNGPPDNAHR